MYNSTLISKLNERLKALIEKILDNNECHDIRIMFRAPKNHYTTPTINIFLYDLRENTDLRTQKTYSKNYSNTCTDVSLQANPTYIDFSYMITAWTSESEDEDNEENDMYDILSYLIEGLVSYSSNPPEFIEKIYLPKLQFFHPLYLSNISEFWSALKGKPRPVIHCTATVPVYPKAITRKTITEIDAVFNQSSLSELEIELFKKGKSEIRVLMIKGNIYVTAKKTLSRNINISVSCQVIANCKINISNSRLTVEDGKIPANSKHQPITLSKIIISNTSTVINTFELVNDPNAQCINEKIIVGPSKSPPESKKTSKKAKPIIVDLNQKTINKIKEITEKEEIEAEAVFIICKTNTYSGTYQLPNLADGQYILEASRKMGITDNQRNNEEKYFVEEDAEITQTKITISQDSPPVIKQDINFK